MATTSTERTLKYNKLRRELGMKQWRIWVTKSEKAALKIKLEKMREEGKTENK